MSPELPPFLAKPGSSKYAVPWAHPSPESVPQRALQSVVLCIAMRPNNDYISLSADCVGKYGRLHRLRGQQWACCYV